MSSSSYYLLRSRSDGSYLAARPHADQPSEPRQSVRYLLLFRQDYEALSYLNAHARDMTDRFAVESVTHHQIINILQRWDFTGIALVQDPLVPRVEFLTRVGENF